MSKNYPHPLLAKEGWLFIIIAIITTIIMGFIANIYLTMLCLVVTIFIIQFFRDPPREIPDIANAILSPADGKIILIAPVMDPYQNKEAIKISIFMNIFNVHSNRIPVDAQVEQMEYIRGKFINADFDKASTDNERNAIVLKLTNGTKITVVQIAGLIARRILCYIKIGQKVQKGERYGFIRFGSRVDLYIDPNCRLNVILGQKVSATTSIIATYN